MRIVPVTFVTPLAEPVTAPLWLFQLWRFITPGLKRNERRYALTFAAVASGLFALGAVLAYFSLRAGLKVLLGLAGSNVAVALTAQDYLGFVVSVLLERGDFTRGTERPARLGS